MSTFESSLSDKPLAEGKTKRIFATKDPAKVIIVSKDDITAGDGAKHDTIVGKAVMANQTTCNVFRLLKSCGIPVAFIGQVSDTTFGAPRCTMLPYEVVVRREAHGSYLKRAPHLKKGHVFPRLIVEFFLKTSGRKWGDHMLVCDDPLMIHDADMESIYLYDPKEPDLAQSPAASFLTLRKKEVFSRDDEERLLKEMDEIARKVFLILEKAWHLQGRKIVDFKVEFGLSPTGKLLLADVIDNDSWRVLDIAGNYMDKQVYRDGGNLNEVTAKYKLVAELTGRFEIPLQQLVFWRWSEKDDFKIPHNTAVRLCLMPLPVIKEITCSIQQPTEAYRLLQECLWEIPDTVIIALIGRSNGVGPTLSANTTIPVITTQARDKEFPNVSAMTVLDPANAVLAALQILAMRNPNLYSAQRFEREKRQ